jgi:hypothetical protein
MDISKSDENHYTVVISERNTGILIDPETLERWTERSGGKDCVHASSLEEARHVAADICSIRTDLGAMILDFQGRFVERII